MLCGASKVPTAVRRSRRTHGVRRAASDHEVASVDTTRERHVRRALVAVLRRGNGGAAAVGRICLHFPESDATMTFQSFFATARGSSSDKPFPYQERLATEAWPELLDIPTGLGKTAAVVLAWAYKRSQGDTGTPRRLVYCLPMRSLVEQTAAEAKSYMSNLGREAEVHSLLGGADAEELRAFLDHPEREAILVGTQDMLLSRALNRGYGMSRYQWPIAFGLLHNDALWVFDETQLMGVGVETSAQLEGLRRKLGSLVPSRSLWVSATLGRRQIETVDHPRPSTGFVVSKLSDADRAHPTVRTRVESRKSVTKASLVVPSKAGELAKYAEAVADLILRERKNGGRTLGIFNRVQRAQAVYSALVKKLGSAEAVTLIHSRFRAADRRAAEAKMREAETGIVIATQAIEAGVDITSAVMVSEIAPWSSMVQRLGRLNRYGECADARCLWIGIEAGSADGALPYEPDELQAATEILERMTDVGPASLASVDAPTRSVIRPVLRRRDLLDLFDTTPELLGQDLDVSRYIRDGDDLDVSVFWRELDRRPDGSQPSPSRDELCSVSLSQARAYLERLAKASKEADAPGAQAYAWDPLAERWVPTQRPHPGQVLMVGTAAGGYDTNLGFTGEASHRPKALAAPSNEGIERESSDADPATAIGTWVELADHLGHVEEAARVIVQLLEMDARWRRSVLEAARFHDVGKAHPVFQQMLGPADTGRLWAKSAGTGTRSSRPGFRHEWASALAWLQTVPEGTPDRELVAYLIAAHHGKVRMSVRSSPIERAPDDDRVFARGVWDGDELPAVNMPDGRHVPALALDASPVRMGPGCWLEMTARLRDDPEIGPFALAYLEALVRVADARASRDERLAAHIAEGRIDVQ